MNEALFREWVAEALDELPVMVTNKLENLVFLVRRRPTRAQYRTHGLGAGATLFGLYEGVSLPERGDFIPDFPDTITLFMDPICAMYESETDRKTCIRNTLWHELAHYFGYDEEWVAAEEQIRGKTI
jgi:predicted Zn-dependent protease with MMP-like domain